MHVLVLAAFFAIAMLPTLAPAEQSCADKCKTEMTACDAATCAPGRRACVTAKCEGPRDIKCRVACIKEFEPCFEPCSETRAKCLAACGQK